MNIHVYTNIFQSYMENWSLFTLWIFLRTFSISHNGWKLMFAFMTFEDFSCFPQPRYYGSLWIPIKTAYNSPGYDRIAWCWTRQVTRAQRSGWSNFINTLIKTMSETSRTRADDGNFHKHGCVFKNVYTNIKTYWVQIKFCFTTALCTLCIYQVQNYMNILCSHIIISHFLHKLQHWMTKQEIALKYLQGIPIFYMKVVSII